MIEPYLDIIPTELKLRGQVNPLYGSLPSRSLRA